MEPLNALVKERLDSLSIKTLHVIPYKHVTSYQNTSTNYTYIYIYQIINGIRILTKMLNTHIFMVYIPLADQEMVESLLQKKNMKELTKLYFERYLNISPSLPYCELGMFYMETLPEKFSFSIKQNGHKDNLTELDIFSLLYNFWKAYYSDTFYGLVNDPDSTMYNQFRDILHKDTPVTLFTAPYDHSKNQYINLLKLIALTILNANHTSVSASCVNCSLSSNVHGDYL